MTWWSLCRKVSRLTDACVLHGRGCRLANSGAEQGNELLQATGEACLREAGVISSYVGLPGREQTQAEVDERNARVHFRGVAVCS